MSEMMLAGLPRFDDGPARAPGSWRRPLDEMIPSGIADAVKNTPPGDESGSREIPESAPCPRPADLTEVETALKTLCARLDRIEREAQTQAMQAVQAMTAKLFPELSRMFLAEEIGQSLPKLVPASAAVIEIRAGAELAASLQARISGMPALARRCTVLPSGPGEAGRADISWQTGGVSFDFDALFATLHAQLNPSQPMTRE